MDQSPYDYSSYDLTSYAGPPYLSIDAMVSTEIDSGLCLDINQFTTPPDQDPFFPISDSFIAAGQPYTNFRTFDSSFVTSQDQYVSCPATREAGRKVNQPARTRSRVTLEEWELRKPSIKRYYYQQNLSLLDTMDIMKRMGFYASTRKYKEQIKQWGWKKNLNSRQIHWVKKKALTRRKQNQKLEIVKNGRTIPPDKIERYIRNHTRSEYSATGETVSGIDYSRTPPPAHECHTPPPAREVYSMQPTGGYDTLQPSQDIYHPSPVNPQYAQQLTLSGLVNPTRGNDTVGSVIAENMQLFPSSDMQTHFLGTLSAPNTDHSPIP